MVLAASEDLPEPAPYPMRSAAQAMLDVEVDKWRPVQEPTVGEARPHPPFPRVNLRPHPPQGAYVPQLLQQPVPNEEPMRLVASRDDLLERPLPVLLEEIVAVVCELVDVLIDLLLGQVLAVVGEVLLVQPRPDLVPDPADALPNALEDLGDEAHDSPEDAVACHPIHKSMRSAKGVVAFIVVQVLDEGRREVHTVRVDGLDPTSIDRDPRHGVDAAVGLGVT